MVIFICYTTVDRNYQMAEKINYCNNLKSRNRIWANDDFDRRSFGVERATDDNVPINLRV